MTNQIKSLALIALIPALIVSACNSSEKKDDTDRTASDTNLTQPVATDTINVWKNDWEKFKADSRTQIKENEDSIEAFKMRVEQGKSKMKAQSEKRIAELKEKNEQMKQKLDAFKENSKEKWEQFKTDFTRDMDTLGHQLKDLTKNTK